MEMAGYSLRSFHCGFDNRQLIRWIVLHAVTVPGQLEVLGAHGVDG